MILFRMTPALLLIAVPLMTAVPWCRYTVRDVGFVVLDEQPYMLSVHRSSPENAARLRDFCRAFFLDADVSLELRDEAGASLSDSFGRSLDLQWTTASGGLAAIQDDIAAVIGSDARDEVLTKIVESHGVIVLADGESEAGNERVLARCTQAVERAAPILAELPKAAANAAQIVRIPWGDRSSERVFLFGMGFDMSEIDSADPLVTVLYGRGVVMGEPLFGPLITRTQIEENLILIGQDCECDLERSVLRGRRVLLTWDDDHRSAAQRTLEFDPENPLVRAEVSRILSRGREEKGTSQGSSSTDYLESEIPRVSDDKGKTPNSSASASVERGMSGLYLVLGAFIGVTLFGAVWLLVRRGSAF